VPTAPAEHAAGTRNWSRVAAVRDALERLFYSGSTVLPPPDGDTTTREAATADGWRGEGLSGPVPVEYAQRAVWLDLGVAFPAPAGHRRRSTAEGLVLSGRTPAHLMRWVRSHDGAWYGLLGRLELYDGAGARRLVLEHVLAPAAALRPRG
jgi:hypothetical protein